MFWKRTPKPEATLQKPKSASPPVVPIIDRSTGEPNPTNSKAPEAPAKSFDPYNSGAFERRDAWGKVIRK